MAGCFPPLAQWQPVQVICSRCIRRGTQHFSSVPIAHHFNQGCGFPGSRKILHYSGLNLLDNLRPAQVTTPRQNGKGA